MSENRVVTFPTGAIDRADGQGRLPRWLRRQEALTRANRRERAQDADRRIGEIKLRWREACMSCGLGQMIYTSSGPTMSIPRIGRVTLGSPTTFTVRPQPGQLPVDFEAAAPRIAAAMGVAGIRVRPLVAEWIVIELQETPAGPRRAAVPPVGLAEAACWLHPDRELSIVAA